MTPIKISVAVDLQANAAYIKLSEETVVRTEPLDNSVLVDLDANDVVVGIETLRIDAPIPFADLGTRFHVHSDVIEALKRIRPNPSAFVEFFSAVNTSATTTLQHPILTAA